MTLLIAGWIAIDDIETPFTKVTGMLGGSATPAALAAALFTDVRLLAAIGDDFPRAELEKFAGRPIDLAGVRVERGTTSRWGGRYSYDMNSRETVYTDIGVNEGWQPRLPAGWEASETAILAALYPALQLELMAALHSPLATLVDTIKFYIDNVPEGVHEAMRKADFVSINEIEARELAGTPSVAKAARAIVAAGTHTAIVKLGEYGALCASRDGDYFVAPGYPLENVVDPTGAGDAFAGAFLGYIDSVRSISPSHIRRAMVYGSTVASFQVEGIGPERLLRLTRREVEERFREFRALTHYDTGE